ncbi:MAG: Asp-tRNA(Asn)/Glu-tRNA(Gln) amidotransferase subunit GatB [Myxococcaceae bacterium]
MPVSDFQPVIGLEVHAQLLTQSKIFCGCSTKFGAPPNQNTCPVCLGMPGVLPVLNERVVEFAIRAGLALSCTVKKQSVWSRKNYFYPDLPKGYQITQFDQPICEHGKLSFESAETEKTVRILRIQMEEDAGKNVHDADPRSSLVDLNRAGTPLLEIVSEPDLRSSEEATDYLRALRDVVVYIGVNDGNMDEGSFRCDANVSVMPKGSSTYGTRVELKNINSFRFVREAIDYEIKRQVELIESGGKVVQETRLFDPDRGETRSMRSKEDAHDYRYFPEPDLPPLQLYDAQIDAVAKVLPELPRAKLQRFQTAFGLPAYDAKLLCADKPLADFFESVAAHYNDYKKISNWCHGELLRLINESNVTLQTLRLTSVQFASLLAEVDKGTLSNNAAKGVLAEMFKTGGEPSAIIAEKGLAQVSDVGAVEAVVEEVLRKNASEVEKYKAGQQKVYGFLVGQVMKAMKGKGNPALVNELLKKKLGEAPNS